MVKSNFTDSFESGIQSSSHTWGDETNSYKTILHLSQNYCKFFIRDSGEDIEASNFFFECISQPVNLIMFSHVITDNYNWVAVLNPQTYYIKKMSLSFFKIIVK